MASPDPERTLPVEDAGRLAALAETFEQSWVAGRTPPLENFVAQVEERIREQAFRELLKIEARLRRRRGEKMAAGDYLDSFPQYAAVVRDICSTGDDSGDTVDPAGHIGRPGFHVRCPHCHNPIELVPEAKLDSIGCGSCGSYFSLTNDEDEATRDARHFAQVGHFKLVERLGMGAFGTVWKAQDIDLDRTVAIKIPRAGRLEKQHQELFLREARSAAQLHHPNIVPVYEVGRDGETLYIVSELVRGVTLADRRTAGPLGACEAAVLCAKIADALHHAHEQGIIHRDLKPGNVMQDANGEPHLMDFGLARREAAHEITMTVDGQVLGTPAYMSPEQAQGEGHAADRRSDVYSLGVILFDLLTGELPFRGNARMLLHQVIHDDPPSPRKINATISKDLETITLKCMEKSPARRYSSGAELADELRRFLRREPIVARPVPGWERGAKWVRRHPTTSGQATLVGLAILAGVAGLVWHRSLERQANNTLQLLEILLEQFNPVKLGGFNRSSPSTSQKISARDILDRSLKVVRRYAEGLSPEPRAEILDEVGDAFAGLGSLTNASQCLSEALEIRRTLGNKAELAETLHNLGFLDFCFGRFDDAERHLKEALDLRTAVYANANPAHPDIAHTRLILAATLLERGYTPEIRGLLLDAKKADLNDHDRLFVIGGLAIVSARQGRFDKAALYSVEAIPLLAKGDEVTTMFVKVARAVVNQQRGANAEAADGLKEVLPDAERIVGENHPALHIMRIDLTRSYQRMGNFDDVLQIISRTAELAKEGFGSQPRTAEAVYMLGDVLRDQERIVDARESYQEAYDILKACGQLEMFRGAEVYYRRGMMALADGDDAMAQKEFRKALELNYYRLEAGSSSVTVVRNYLWRAELSSSRTLVRTAFQSTISSTGCFPSPRKTAVAKSSALSGGASKMRSISGSVRQ